MPHFRDTKPDLYRFPGSKNTMRVSSASNATMCSLQNTHLIPAVYYTSPSLSEVRLSGVGLRRSTDKTDYFTVPVGELERRDNEGHLPIDARVLKDEDGQYGFVFHDACWLLVKESKEERSLWTD